MKSEKMWQVLADMNKHDIENGTKLVQLSNQVMSIDETKKVKKVTFGLPIDAFKNYDLMKGKIRLVVMAVDADEYDKRFND